MFDSIINIFKQNEWMTIAVLIWLALKAIDDLLSFIAPLTKNKYDDRVAAILGRVVASMGKLLKRDK